MKNKYFTVFLILSVIGTGLLSQANPALHEYELKTHELVNDFRESAGLKRLDFDETVADQCREHSRFMAALSGSLSHDGFRDRVKRIQETIPLRSAAENVASNLNTPDPCSTAVTGWINSPPHKENMVNDWDITGIGVSISPEGKFYFTQIFVLLQDTALNETYTIEEIETGLKSLTDDYRAASGAVQIAWSDTLSSIARQISQELSKESSDSRRVLSSLTDSVEKYYNIEKVGEIISTSSGLEIPHEEIFGHWMEDSGYRSLLGGDFDIAGVGIVLSPENKHFAVMVLVKLTERR
ncbi:CAP domain-containing protein [candidate division WOR-3 bacterium]|nr:CAP domain-containing protein [candidate division WOR-3 bacterium]